MVENKQLQSIANEEGFDFEKVLRDIELLQSIVDNWDDSAKNTVKALTESIDSLHKETFTRLIRQLKSDPLAAALLKQSLRDPLIYTVLRYHELIKPALQERIETALESIRPMLAEHGGNVELVSIEAPNTITIRLLGACNGCPASELTLSEGVERAVKEHCPEITEIKKASGLAVSESVPVQIRNLAPRWQFIATADQLPDEGFAIFSLNGRSLVVAHAASGIVCYENACAHLGMPLDEAVVADGILKCPFHDFEYELESGNCRTATGVSLRKHQIRTAGAALEVLIS